MSDIRALNIVIHSQLITLKHNRHLQQHHNPPEIFPSSHHHNSRWYRQIHVLRVSHDVYHCRGRPSLIEGGHSNRFRHVADRLRFYCGVLMAFREFYIAFSEVYDHRTSSMMIITQKTMIRTHSVVMSAVSTATTLIHLQKLTLPANITAIGERSFDHCASLAFLDLSKIQIKSIGVKAFIQCTSLTDFIFPETIDHIGESAFSTSNIFDFADRQLLTTIGPSAFFSCMNLKTAYPGQSNITEIADYAFSQCVSLSKSTLPPNWKR